MIVAVTGTIGSGKSVVAVYLAELLQADHCDADRLCREFLKKHGPGWLQVKARWGKRFLDAEQSIDRVALREAVFSDSSVQKDLEAILHPLVYSVIRDKIAISREEGRDLVVEIPLLFETGRQGDFEYIVTVFARPECCIERVMARDSVSREQALRALDAQMDIDTKVNGSDYVIDNSTTLAQTRMQVAALSRLLQESRLPKNRCCSAPKTLDS